MLFRIFQCVLGVYSTCTTAPVSPPYLVLQQSTGKVVPLNNYISKHPSLYVFAAPSELSVAVDLVEQCHLQYPDYHVEITGTKLHEEDLVTMASTPWVADHVIIPYTSRKM